MIKRLSSKGEAWQSTANLRKLAQLLPQAVSAYLEKIAAEESLSEAAAKARAMRNLRLLGLSAGAGLGVGAGAVLAQRLSQSLKLQGEGRPTKLMRRVTEPIKMYVHKKTDNDDEDEGDHKKQSGVAEINVERTPLSWDTANVALAILGGGTGLGVGYLAADNAWKTYRKWRRNKKVQKSKQEFEKSLIESGTQQNEPKSAEDNYHARAKLDEVVGEIFDEMEKAAWPIMWQKATNQAMDWLGRYYLAIAAGGLLGGVGLGMYHGKKLSTGKALDKVILQRMAQRPYFYASPSIQIEEVEPEEEDSKKKKKKSE